MTSGHKHQNQQQNQQQDQQQTQQQVQQQHQKQDQDQNQPQVQQQNQDQQQNQQQVQQQDRQKCLASFYGCATRDQRTNQSSSSVNSGSECERRVSSWVIIEKAVCIWTDSPCVLSLIHGNLWPRSESGAEVGTVILKRLLQTWLIVYGWFWAEGWDANAMGRLHNNISDDNRSAQLKELGIIGNTRLKLITYLLEEAGSQNHTGAEEQWQDWGQMKQDEKYAYVSGFRQIKHSVITVLIKSWLI